MLFIIHGMLNTVPSTTVLFHLESLGYSTRQIAVIDTVLVNIMWSPLRYHLPKLLDQDMGRLHVPLKSFGVLFWLALCFFPLPLFMMFCSESCIALSQTAYESRGLSAHRSRRIIVGNILGSLLGNYLLKHTNKETVYATEALLFWLSLVVGAYSNPIEPVPKQQDNQKSMLALAQYIILLNALPDAQTALFFFFSDRLRFSPVEYAWMDASSAIFGLIGTFLIVRRVDAWFAMAYAVYNVINVAVVARMTVGVDLPLLLVAGMPVSVLGSILSTQYMADASTDAPYWSSLPFFGKVLGFASSNFLMWAYGVNHDMYRGLLDLTTVVAIGSFLPVLFCIYKYGCVAREKRRMIKRSYSV